MILVTGATGRVGRLVVDGLAREGAPVRAMVRDPRAATVPPGIEVAVGDLSTPASLERCLDGVDSVFLVWGLGGTEASERAIGAIARHARRVVYVSTAAIRDDLDHQVHPLSAMHAENERLVRESILEWTILRATKFATNLLGWAPDLRSRGFVEFPYPDARRSPIHQADIAAVAIRALMDGSLSGGVHVLSGPESLTEREQVRIVGEVAGRLYDVREIGPEQARRASIEAGVAPDLADAALDLWQRLVTVPEPLTGTVEAATGVPPRPFRQWVVENVEAFR